MYLLLEVACLKAELQRHIGEGYEVVDAGF